MFWLGFMAYQPFCRLSNAKSIFMQIISSISNDSVKHKYTYRLIINVSISSYSVKPTVLIQFISTDFVYTLLNVKTVLLNNSV